MYKKKLAVRVMTAITVGALLANNAMVATAQPVAMSADAEAEDSSEATGEEEAEKEGEELAEEITEEEETSTEEGIGEEVTETEDLAEELTQETKTVTLNFYDEDTQTQVDEAELEVEADATYVNSKDIEVPEGYEIVVTGDLAINDGYVYVQVRKAEAESKTVTLNFYDEDTQEQVAEVELEVASDATYVNTKDIEVPDGYEIVVTGDLAINDGYVYVQVRKAEAKTKTVKLNFFDEEAYKQVAEVEMEVALDATYVNTGDMSVPAGYEIVVTGDLAINDGYVYVQVRKAEAKTKTVKLNFFDEEAYKQVAEVEMEVASDATYVNTGDMSVPAGYEVVVTGDLNIVDGYVYVQVRKIEQKLTVNFNASYGSVEGSWTDSVPAENAKTFVLSSMTADAELQVPDIKAPEGYRVVCWYSNIGKIKLNLGDSFTYEQLVTKLAAIGGSEYVAFYPVFESTTPGVKRYNVSVMTEDGTELAYYPELLETQELTDTLVSAVIDDINETTAKKYEFVSKAQAENGTWTIVVKEKSETPVDPEERKVDATLRVDYRYNNTLKGVQTFVVKGKAGEKHIFKASELALKAPAGYRIQDTFTDTSVAYGETATVTVTLKMNGGGSSSGGSGSSSSRGGSVSGSKRAITGGWQLNDTGWWYQFSNSSYAQKGWYTLTWQDRQDWYYFDENGYLVSGWYTDGANNKYFLHDVHDGTFGRMYTGWNKVEGQWRFFNDDTENGVYGALVEGVAVPAELMNQ